MAKMAKHFIDIRSQDEDIDIYGEAMNRDNLSQQVIVTPPRSPMPQSSERILRLEDVEEVADLFRKNSAKRIPKEVVENKNGQMSSEFECPVCSELMVAPLQIFACSNDHFICSICVVDPSIKVCPICREDFKKKKPKRRLASERHLEILRGNGLL